MAGLKDRLKADKVAAMKARDQVARLALDMVLTAIQREEVAGDAARVLTDDEILKVLTREVNSRRDSAEAYTLGRRPELAERELAEAEILQAYLPAALTEDELDALVTEELALAAAGLGEKPTMKQLGQVIKAVNARAQGRADGRTVAAKVREALG